jgi:uncharacterized membrane protein HdeD (DUF308 family)
MMAADLARSWCLLALRGVVGILFGIGAFVWPRATLTALVIIFGADALVDGVFAVGAGIGMSRLVDRWWLLILEGLAGIILGVLSFVSPVITALVLLSCIAAWAIITGAFEIAVALRLRTLIANEWLLIVSDIVSLLFGTLLIVFPESGALSVVWLIGSYALLFGILTLVRSFRLGGMRNTSGRQAARPA